MGTAVYPVFSRLSPTSDPPVRVVFDRGLKLVLALMLPLAVGGVILGRPLVELIYGADYDQADEALLILSPAIAFHGLAHVAALLLVSQNRQVVLAVVQGVVAALNVAANFALIPLLSLEGAASVGARLAGALDAGSSSATRLGRRAASILAGSSPARSLASVLSAIAMAGLARRPVAGDRGRGAVYVPVRSLIVRAHARTPDDAEGDPRLPCRTATMIAVVTGGSRGIGKAIAGALRESGAAGHTTSRPFGRRRRHGRAMRSRLLSASSGRSISSSTTRAPWTRSGPPGRSIRTTGGATSRRACSARSTAHGRFFREWSSVARGRIVNVSSGAGDARLSARLGLRGGEGGALQLHAVARRRDGRARDRGLRDQPGVRLDGDDRGSARLALVPRTSARRTRTSRSAPASSSLRLASGELDALSGRFIHVRDDIDQLLSE